MADKPFRPMLADNKFNLAEHGKDLHFPALLSPKLDGIRVVLHPELGAVTRNLKPVRNRYARETLNALMEEHPETVWLDGEIIVGDPTAPNAYNATSSGIQSFEGEPDFAFYVFDKYHPTEPFAERIIRAKDSLDTRQLPERFQRHLSFVGHKHIDNLEDLKGWEGQYVEQGYEGAMYRHPEGLYKQGCSTLKQQWLLKVKRWGDCEGEVIGFEERLINGNEQTTSETGYAQRSSHKENMVPSGLLGAYEVKILNGEFAGKICMVSPALHTHEMLKEVWEDQWSHMFKTMTFTHFPHGSKDLPRFPKFLRWREDSV